MLAYRHAFHAGNHGDVLKHVVLVQLLRHLTLKDKGLRLVDTHAGAGMYSLDSREARKKGEFHEGIGRLWQRGDLPAPVADYVQLVRRFNADGRLARYPGSPSLAHALLRPQDEMRLFELHPTDHKALAAHFAGQRHMTVTRSDGFAALKAQLPPPTRRALVLVDPSYEGLHDYIHVVEALRDALRRFADGVYLVWYPLVAKPGADRMLRTLKSLAVGGWLHARLAVQPPDVQGFGLLGSGVFVVNPPHTLHPALRDALPYLAAVLAQYDRASHRLEQQAV